MAKAGGDILPRLPDHPVEKTGDCLALKLPRPSPRFCSILAKSGSIAVPASSRRTMPITSGSRAPEASSASVNAAYCASAASRSIGMRQAKYCRMFRLRNATP